MNIGHLEADFDPADGINWLHPTIWNTKMSPDMRNLLNEVIRKLLNKPARISNVGSMSALEIAG